MQPAERSELVRAEATAAGFDLCGIAAAAALPRADFFERWLADGLAGTMSYLHRHRESRFDVRNWLPWAKSIVVVGQNYKQADLRPGSCTFSMLHSPLPLRGRVAMYAWGEDYHVVLRGKLDAIVERLRNVLSAPFQARVCVDTSAIIEREIAAAAGLGWIGKNTMVLHPRLGSFLLLGEIVTDLDLAPDTPMADHCGTCTRCLEACPAQAFPTPYVMDARRCISYLTIEHRGEIDGELAAKMGDWVFGCDVCQDVCPHNRRAPATNEPRFRADADHVRPRLDDITAWDDTAYQAFTRGRATRRARLAMWRRNAKIVARNIAPRDVADSGV
jgi:epoxyqueuosine reductase